MKKLIPVLIGIMLVLTLAVAADVTPVNFPIDDETGSFDVSYDGTAGAYYALVVVEGEYTADQTPDINEDTIQYINQQTADTAGNVTFEDVLLKDDLTKSTVYLGGSDLSEAVLLGYVAGPLEISVTAGDIIYLQDGTKKIAETTTDAYEIPADYGYVVVNTVDAAGVQTAQKVYKIENSLAVDVTEYTNGALNSNSASIKADEEEKTGIRYKSKFASALKASVKEYGFVVTIESAKVKKILKDNGKSIDTYELGLDLIDIGAAVKGVAYSKETGVDKFDSEDVATSSKIVFGVVTGMKVTATNVLTNVALRPYYILEDGTVIYGEIAKNTVYDVAAAIKKNDADTYAKYTSYIDSILDSIKGDVIIPGSDLFN